MAMRLGTPKPANPLRQVSRGGVFAIGDPVGDATAGEPLAQRLERPAAVAAGTGKRGPVAF